MQIFPFIHLTRMPFHMKREPFTHKKATLAHCTHKIKCLGSGSSECLHNLRRDSETKLFIPTGKKNPTLVTHKAINNNNQKDGAELRVDFFHSMLRTGNRTPHLCNPHIFILLFQGTKAGLLRPWVDPWKEERSPAPGPGWIEAFHT